MPTMFIQVEHFCIVYVNKVLEVGHSRSTYNPSTGEVEAG